MERFTPEWFDKVNQNKQDVTLTLKGVSALELHFLTAFLKNKSFFFVAVDEWLKEGTLEGIGLASRNWPGRPMRTLLNSQRALLEALIEEGYGWGDE